MPVIHMSEENLQSAENAAPEAAAAAPVATGEEMMPRSEAENLLKALKAEREARKQYERDLKARKGEDAGNPKRIKYRKLTR